VNVLAGYTRLKCWGDVTIGRRVLFEDAQSGALVNGTVCGFGDKDSADFVVRVSERRTVKISAIRHAVYVGELAKEGDDADHRS
jgi:hypothetical protein